MNDPTIFIRKRMDKAIESFNAYSMAIKPPITEAQQKQLNRKKAEINKIVKDLENAYT